MLRRNLSCRRVHRAAGMFPLNCRKGNLSRGSAVPFEELSEISQAHIRVWFPGCSTYRAGAHRNGANQSIWLDTSGPNRVRLRLRLYLHLSFRTSSQFMRFHFIKMQRFKQFCKKVVQALVSVARRCCSCSSCRKEKMPCKQPKRQDISNRFTPLRFKKVIKQLKNNNCTE